MTTAKMHAEKRLAAEGKQTPRSHVNPRKHRSCAISKGKAHACKNR